MAHVNEELHRFTCHSHVFPQVERGRSAFTPQLQSINALWLVLISCPAWGMRLSWPEFSSTCALTTLWLVKAGS